MLRDFDFNACFPCYSKWLHVADKLIWLGKSSHFQTHWQKISTPCRGVHCVRTTCLIISQTIFHMLSSKYYCHVVSISKASHMFDFNNWQQRTTLSKSLTQCSALDLSLVVLVCDVDCWAQSYNGQFNHLWQTTDKLVLVVADRCWNNHKEQEPNTADSCRYQGQCVGPARQDQQQAIILILSVIVSP